MEIKTASKLSERDKGIVTTIQQQKFLSKSDVFPNNCKSCTVSLLLVTVVL